MASRKELGALAIRTRVENILGVDAGTALGSMAWKVESSEMSSLTEMTVT
jgi:hypothetical protein